MARRCGEFFKENLCIIVVFCLFILGACGCGIAVVVYISVSKENTWIDPNTAFGLGLTYKILAVAALIFLGLCCITLIIGFIVNFLKKKKLIAAKRRQQAKDANEENLDTKDVMSNIIEQTKAQTVGNIV